MTKLVLTMVSASYALLVGCTDGQFGGGASRSGNGDLQKGETERDSQDLGTEALGEDPEETDADAPIMVTGAFLTCVEDTAVSAVGDEVGFGCVIKDKDKKLTLDGFDKVEWSLLGLFNAKLPAVFTKAPAALMYNTTASASAATIALSKVRLRVEKDGKSTEYYSSILTVGGGQRPPGNVGGGAIEAVLGDTSDFQLGDDNYDGNVNLGCNDRLAGVNLRGAGLVIPIKVTVEATVALSLQQLCGVTLASNTVLFTSGTRTLYEDNIRAKATSFEATGVVLGPGDYKVKILSNMTNRGRDDFIVGRIVFTHSGVIEVGTPTAISDF